MSTTFKAIDIKISASDLEKIAGRKNFKGEEFFPTLGQAEERAKERSLTTKKMVYVGSGNGEFIVHTHGVELIGFRIVNSYTQGNSNSMINLVQAKKQAATLSAESKNRVYIVENGVNDYMTSNAPYKGTIGYCLDGEFIPNDLTKTEMAKKVAPKKAVKKVAAKKVVKKVAAKKVAAKKEVSKEKPAGKVVNISIADMRKKMEDGFYYRDPQGTRQSENYLASRAKQDWVRTGMQEFKA